MEAGPETTMAEVDMVVEMIEIVSSRGDLSGAGDLLHLHQSRPRLKILKLFKVEYQKTSSEIIHLNA